MRNIDFILGFLWFHRLVGQFQIVIRVMLNCSSVCPWMDAEQYRAAQLLVGLLQLRLEINKKLIKFLESVDVRLQCIANIDDISLKGHLIQTMYQKMVSWRAHTSLAVPDVTIWTLRRTREDDSSEYLKLRLEEALDHRSLFQHRVWMNLKIPCPAYSMSMVSMTMVSTS